MTELVERLRALSDWDEPDVRLLANHELTFGDLNEAAETILNLRSRVEELEEGLARHNCGVRFPVKCICVESIENVDARRAALSDGGVGE